MSGALPLTIERLRFVIVCFGLEQACARRQPWHVAVGIARGLAALGHEAVILTDAREPPVIPGCGVGQLARLLVRGRASAELQAAVRALRPDRVFLLTGATELARMRALRLGAPVELVIASPRLSWRELRRLDLRAIWAERAQAWLPLVGALLPALLLRRGYARSGAAGAIYLSHAARERYAAAGLPVGRLLRPQVEGPVCIGRPHGAARPVVAYFGPALGLRGADLALTAFETALRRGLDAELLMLLRPDGPAPATARLLRRITASPAAQRIRVETAKLRPSELRLRLAQAAVFLLPFRLPVSEVPLVVIEAGLSGRPVVVLDAPGVGEIARALGGTVATRPADLPDALIRACAHGCAAAPPDPRPWTRWERAVAPLLDSVAHPLGDYRLIAFAGIDGAGKTLLADRLAAELATAGLRPRRVWSRFRNYASKPLLALARLTGHNRRERVAGVTVGYHEFAHAPWLAWPFLLLQALDQLADMLVRFRPRGGVLIADRCLFDTLVDLAIDTGQERLLLGRLGRWLIRRLPRPALVVIVRRPPAQILQDRPDAFADRHFARRRALYERLAAAFDLPTLDNDDTVEVALARLTALARDGQRLRP